MGLNIITNELPQKGGRFYTLAKRFHKTNQTKPGSDNWLSDMRVNEETIPAATLTEATETFLKVKFGETVSAEELQKAQTRETLLQLGK